MMVVKGFVAEGKDYLVLDGTKGFMPGPAAMRLLMDKQEGVGADKALVLAGSHEHAAICAFLPDGSSTAPSRRELQVLRGKVSYELRLTDSFVARMREADRSAECLMAAS